MKRQLVAKIVGLMFLVSTEYGFCAEIRFQKGPEGYERHTAIVINGEIEEGDFERFVSAALEAGTDPGRVYISSPGVHFKIKRAGSSSCDKATQTLYEFEVSKFLGIRVLPSPVLHHLAR